MDLDSGARKMAQPRMAQVRASQIAFIAIAISTIFGLNPASAVTGDVVFTGNVTTANQCVITVVNDGVFGVRADKMQLSSKLAGGVSAVADVRSNHAYNISAIAVPTLTSYPTGGNTGVTTQSWFSGGSILKGSTFGEQNGNVPVTLRNGLSRTRVTINLVATRTGSPYPQGYYQGTVTLRCE